MTAGPAGSPILTDFRERRCCSTETARIDRPLRHGRTSRRPRERGDPFGFCVKTRDPRVRGDDGAGRPVAPGHVAETARQPAANASRVRLTGSPPVQTTLSSMRMPP
ncbi:hypothetical protein FQY83_11050 [Luteimonas marina]|uniref:Uncharacterized protein n=1 Tax=Luteimonas marina TaxID=488485 RepID=A0A5C5U460_9GAMM|nr:hypothetical protein FQY83_11050 [Luteimonas marina]